MILDPWLPNLLTIIEIIYFGLKVNKHICNIILGYIYIQPKKEVAQEK